MKFNSTLLKEGQLMKKTLAIAALVSASMSAQATTLSSFTLMGKASACTGALSGLALDSSGDNEWPTNAAVYGGTAPTASFTIQKIAMTYHTDAGGGYQAWATAYIAHSSTNIAALTGVLPPTADANGASTAFYDFGPDGVAFDYTNDYLWVASQCTAGTSVNNNVNVTIWYTQP